MSGERFSGRLRRAREAAGFRSQSALARHIAEIGRGRIKISQQTISYYETGEDQPSAENAMHLSRVLGVPVAWLIAGDGDIDVNRLQSAIVTVETVLKKERRKMTVEQRAVVIAQTYAMLAEPGKRLEETEILTLIRMTA